ncbi:MAG: cytochrome b/b6 domain-containing protein [Chloroflexi bacterium]|nr:cytochrome b/b6 domain-containing protein [Chloroflexota bacterium]
MTNTTTSPQMEERSYERFPLARRIEHLTMLLSFTTLGLTGLIQKFPFNAASQFLIGILGGVDTVRSIHHFAAIVLMFGTMYHIILLGYNLYVLRIRMTMLPVIQDGLDALQALLYNIGLRKSRPQMGRFTFEEKAEYWAFVWGTAVMGVTGFMMWNPITSAKFLPGEFIPAAKAAHGGEAVLAVLAIILWHMYGVHIKFFNKAMWTGKLTETEMLHEHPLELADIKAGLPDREQDPLKIRQRRRKFFPVASILTLGMLAGIFGFINAEDTALTTVPPQDDQPVEVYIHWTATPRNTSTPTIVPSLTAIPADTATPFVIPSFVTWDANIGPLFQLNCGECHVDDDKGGLNLSTYADAMRGGRSGAAFTAGDSAASPMIIKFESGDHTDFMLSTDDLALVKAWLDAGALEK